MSSNVCGRDVDVVSCHHQCPLCKILVLSVVRCFLEAMYHSEIFKHYLLTNRERPRFNMFVMLLFLLHLIVSHLSLCAWFEEIESCTYFSLKEQFTR